jgi:DNA-binding SARP family transcriptional activator/TolB-like protein
MLCGNRFRLITLGRLTLVGPGGEEDASLARRRFKLALLAVLAQARRPVTRDALLGMFWAEQDEARARHSLSNALSSLRRALGPRAITTREAEVALATDISFAVDALELIDAAEARDAARVVALYGGPFLDGVYIDGSPAFDQWLSRERRRLERLFVQACAQQCSALARARQWQECGALAARWIDTEPLSADAALFLLNAIKAPGTRAALAQAIDEYEALHTRLARDYELAPEPVVRELADRIREQLAAIPAPAPEVTEVTEVTDVAEVTAVARVEATPVRATPVVPVEVVPAQTPVTPVTPPSPAAQSQQPAPPALGRRIANRGVGMLGATAAMVFVALAMAARQPDLEASGAVAPNVRRPAIAVLPVSVRTGDSTLAWLADGLPQMILGKLAHNGQIDVTPAARVRAVLLRSGRGDHAVLGDTTARDLARRVGATVVARGAISRDGDNIVLELAVQDVSSGKLIRNDVLTRGDALALADEAAARILGATNVTALGPQLAELETSSLEAYQSYLRSVEDAKAGRFNDALRYLDAAVALDSGFVTALRARLAWAINTNDTARVRELRETVRRKAARATMFDRLDQEISDAYYGGERERSEALARELVRRYPRDPRAYQTLGSILGSHGAFEESERVAIQALALDSLAMDAGTGPCTQCAGFFNLLGLRWVRGDLPGAADWSRRWIRAEPDAPAAWASLAWTLSYMQRPDSALPLMQRSVSLAGSDLRSRDELVRMLLVARRYEAADSAIATLEADSTADREKVYDLRALLERERGRFRAANGALDRMVAASPASRGFADMIRADNMRSLGGGAGAARRFEASAHPPSQVFRLPLPAGSARGFCWHHALAADASASTSAGDTTWLRATADTLEAGCSRSYYGRDWRLFHHVRGLIAMQAGRFAEAERELSQARWAPVEGWTRTTVALARAQAALGRPRDAIATLRTGYATRLDAMGRYVPISELDYWMAQTFAQAGAVDSARTYAAFVRSAWRDADPEVRRRLGGLP